MATPVLVGVGEVVQRPGDGEPLDPLSLAAAAAERAAEDAGAHRLLAMADSVEVVNILTWSYADAAGQLAHRVGASPGHLEHTEIGGHHPVRLLDRAAARIAGGQSRVALIAGGESLRSLESALREGRMPDWPPPPPGAQPIDPVSFVTPQMKAIGLQLPSDVYPLYEQGSRRAAGQTQAEARVWAATAWAAASEVAARNPTAWLREPRPAEAIAAVGPENRMVSWPYPKLLNAMLSVDQGAAALVTSTDAARDLGIPEEQWVYPWGGAGAIEVDNVLARPSFDRTRAGEAALDGALGLAGLDISEVDLLELYSCFPCVPRMALRHLGLDLTHPFTVTGGLTFFGGPANNYMLHAIAAMARALRAGEGERGLLYGQGGFETKHHAMVLTRAPGDGYRVDDADARQAAVDAVPAPEVLAGYEGDGTIETFTIGYQRDGTPTQVSLVGLSPDGRRFAGTIEPTPDAIAVLTSDDDEPLGRAVKARASGDGPPVVELAGAR